MKQQLLDLLETVNPKQIGSAIKKNNELLAWVMQHYGGNLSEKAYNALYPGNNVCNNGKNKKFGSITAGYKFCGRANVCQCANESVSKRVSASKQTYTDEQKQAIANKRTTTNLKKYGVANTGQTTQAKQKHTEFYSSSANVNKVTQQIKKTKRTRHNDENFNNRAKAIATCNERYKVTNPWLLSTDKLNPALDILKDKEQLSTFYPRLSVDDIAAQLNVHVQTVYRYLNIHSFREPYKSTFEKEIVYFLQSLGVTNIITNTRKLISKEIDIYLPDYNLAIEYNGIYWHHDQIPHISRTYHYDKFKECEEKGIELFSIFSDSWSKCKDIWKSKIQNKIQKSPQRVYARQTKIIALTASDTKEFLNKHHVQGYCASQICHGLMHNNELVAIMTFSQSRTGIGKPAAASEYELVRYATSCSVVGGASKLLKHFIKLHNPTKIRSYSDNRYSTGNMYKKLGFDLEKENKCGYWYYNPLTKKSSHRFNFTKSKLVKAGHDPDKTERQIMHELGFLRIYDCGTRTWVFRT